MVKEHSSIQHFEPFLNLNNALLFMQEGGINKAFV